MRELVGYLIVIAILALSYRVYEIGEYLRTTHDSRLPPLQEVVLYNVEELRYQLYRELCSLKHGEAYVSRRIECAANMKERYYEAP